MRLKNTVFQIGIVLGPDQARGCHLTLGTDPKTFVLSEPLVANDITSIIALCKNSQMARSGSYQIDMTVKTAN